ncbi:MAG TPA: hypothetical protein VLC07_05460, partial [Solirubrobacterales bacterium]|nr:hypothetical protein [Solirubrobacterales bacterium]
MPDVSDITSTAVQLARKGGKSPAAKQMKDPKKMAAAGAALMALPFAAEGIAKLAGGSSPKEAAKDAGKKAKGKAAEGAKKVASEVADEKLGAGKLAGLKDLFGGSSNGDGSDSGEAPTEAHGSGRRMPIQQSVDVAVDLETAYNQFCQFEDWPQFMHRVTNVSQDDETTIKFTT